MRVSRFSSLFESLLNKKFQFRRLENSFFFVFTTLSLFELAYEEAAAASWATFASPDSFPALRPYLRTKARTPRLLATSSVDKSWEEKHWAGCFVFASIATTTTNVWTTMSRKTCWRLLRQVMSVFASVARVCAKVGLLFSLSLGAN